MLHAYCIRRAGDPGPPPGLTGVGGAPVRLLDAGELGMWVSPAVAGAPTVERLREHDAVVRAALRSATPLPVRYGTAFVDEARARERLGETREEYRAALARVAGRVEMGIRVAWEAPPPPAAGEPVEEGVGPGRAYLERRRRAREGDAALRREADAVLREVEEVFADLDLSTRRRVLPEPGVAGTLAHLVHRGDLGRYRERLDRARNEVFRVSLLPSGPWAPYSFV